MCAGPQYEYLWADGVKVGAAGAASAAAPGPSTGGPVGATEAGCTQRLGQRLAASRFHSVSIPAPPSPRPQVRTPVKLSAPDYINCLFDWVEDQVGLQAAGCKRARRFGA